MEQATNGLTELLDRWLTDDAFRDAFTADPEVAIRVGGFTLTDDDWTALRTAEWNLSDGVLTARTNKPRTRM